MRNPIIVAVLVLSTVAVGLAMPQTGNPNGMWKGMEKRPSGTYDWLHPSDEDLTAAIEQFYAPGAAAPVPYTYLITPAQRTHQGAEEWLGAYIYTPILRARLAAYTAQRKSARKPALSEVRSLAGTLVVNFSFVTPNKGGLPQVLLLEGSGTNVAEEIGPPKERVDRCSGAKLAACYYYAQAVRFEFPESKKLRGVGTLVFHWVDGEKRVPVNLDYLR